MNGAGPDRPAEPPRCRHCRAENEPGAASCWLCEAPDWRPKPGAPVKAGPPAPPPAGSVPWFGLTVTLGGLMVLVAIGVGLMSVEWATVVLMLWWVSLAGTAFARYQRRRKPGLALSLVVGVLIAIVTYTLVLVSVGLLLLVTCSAGRSLGISPPMR